MRCINCNRPMVVWRAQEEERIGRLMVVKVITVRECPSCEIIFKVTIPIELEDLVQI